MANEVRGLLYETITHYALLKALKASSIQGKVFWNQKPDGMSINPDFTIGKDKNEISHLILVTASGSAKNSTEKSWRNLGETFESKSQLQTMPISINLYFKSEVKKGLFNVVDKLFDTTIHFDKKKYFNVIKNWVEKNISLAGATKELREKHFEQAIKADNNLREATELLIYDLEVVLPVKNSQMTSLWGLMSKDYQTAIRQSPLRSRNTYVKRGLGKLLVLGKKVRHILYENHTKSGGMKLKLPDYCYELGFFSKTISGSRLTDDEVKGAINALQSNNCELLIEQCNQRMNDWSASLRGSGDIVKYIDCLENKWSELSTAEGLLKLVKNIEKKPSFGLIEEELENHPTSIWVLYLLFDLLKALDSRKQSFGIAVLAEEAQDYLPKGEFPPANRVWTIVLSDYIYRIGNETLSNDVLLAICKVLSNRVKKISVNSLPKLKSAILISYRNSVLEQKLLPYNNFQPLLWLLKIELEKHQISYKDKCSYTGWINEYAEVGKRVATTPFINVNNIFIHWKTVSDAGRGHKKKELSARARAFKYQYNVESQLFERRTNVDKLVLLVDGTFDDKDLRVLQTSGWDLILYPDEITDFVAGLAK